MTSVHVNETEAITGAPHGLEVQALRGHCIVWFMPYRRADGVLEISEKWREISVEALVIHDHTHHGLKPGTKIVASRKFGNGRNFKAGDHELCTLDPSGLLLIDLAHSPEAIAA